MTNRCSLWVARGCLIAWATLVAAACSDESDDPANAGASSSSGSGTSGSAGAGTGGSGSGGDGGGGASAGTGGAGGSGGDGGGGAGAGTGGSGNHGLTCEDSIFPAFSKACEQDSDCVVLQHMTRCCGDVLFVGVDADDAEAFESAEAACAAEFPQCECPPGPPLAEDGRALDRSSEMAVIARCVEGSCTSEILDLP